MARTPVEAGKMFAGNVFDSLILDVSLPDGNGFDF